MGKGWLIVLLSMGVVAAHPASFNCAKATTPQEKAICASPELSAADDRMAAAYRELLLAASPDIKPEISDGQRLWLREMAVQCKDDGPKTNIAGCLHGYLDTRAKALQNMVLHAGGVTFVWRSITLTAAPDDAQGATAQGNAGNSASGKLEASWPQAIRDTPEWRAWNKAVEALARTMASQGKSDADGKWHKDWAVDMDISVGASVGIVSEQLVTLGINDLWYGHGAAHPNNDTVQFNWMLQQQRELRPDDVFRADSAWDQALQAGADQYLHQTLGDDYGSTVQPDQMPKVLHEIIANPRNWRLDNKGLTIVFQTYAVACRACTPDPLTIPWDQLKPLLNPDFVVPK